MNFEVVPILGIAIILYVISEILKATVFKDNADLKAVIPYFCAIVGAVVAVVIFLVDPGLIGVDNILDAIVAGAVSGLLATGANQAYKQFRNLMNLKDNEESSDK